MSNTTFKSVKSVTEQFSDLNVSGDAVIHERLFVKDLIATIILDGQEIMSKTFPFTLIQANEQSTGFVVDSSNNVEIVAAEITHDGSANNTGKVDLGVSGNTIFTGAPAGTHRVSGVYSQQLGSSGSVLTRSLTAGDSLLIGANNSPQNNTIGSFTVYYYLG